MERLRRLAAVAPGRSHGGRSSAHLSRSVLLERLGELETAPLDRGSVSHLVLRERREGRLEPHRVRITVVGGLEGDRWAEGRRRRTMQVSAMQMGVARVMANGQALSLFGDNLFVDLDLSPRNVPVGTTIRVGTAVLRVSAKVHDPCRKFSARFGAGAFDLTNSDEGRRAGLRGVYLEVLEDGEASSGDVVEVLQRT